MVVFVGDDAGGRKTVGGFEIIGKNMGRGREGGEGLAWGWRREVRITFRDRSGGYSRSKVDR